MKILLTAGPTREPIDPVRFISNRSSGKMGYALAAAAAAAGHEVVLISGPTNLAPPAGVKFHRIETADELWQAVQENLPGVELAIFAAAVADYRVAEVATQKIKKQSDELTLQLVKNVDILGSMRAAGYRGALAGFAAETNDLLLHAKSKLERKGCDLIIANDVSAAGIGFDADENAVTLVFADGHHEILPRQAKSSLAEKLIGVCTNLVK